ncbi:hypothetical protein [Micromonospora aurantiaca (nom. illeg.)]|uniref:hypothetical protein n=1 Tax=Micromonospora aurantiaca (nom. illeg.) TaxID=47850 RepID=UPI001F0C7D09|nr:hypothetical protein [Micromonospora aurantiaca]
MTDLDSLGDDDTLRRNAAHAVDQFASWPAPRLHAGQDRTASVRLLLARSGQVDDVTISRDWRRQAGVTHIGEAVYEAYTCALGSLLETTALEELQRDQPNPARPTQPPATSTEPELDQALWLQRTWGTLHHIDTELAQLTHAPEQPEQRTISSPHGCLTLHLRGTGITAITSDTARVARMDTEQLRLETRSLFRTYELARPGETKARS